MLDKFFKNWGIVSHQLLTYNQFISTEINNILNDESTISFENIELHFSNIFIESPIIIDETKVIKPLFPLEAKRKLLTYDTVLYTDILEYNNNILTNIHYRIPIAKIPVMIKSNLCNLYSKTNDECINLGETIDDPGGYFIINGNERVLVGQMRNAYNRYICYQVKETDSLICEMRSMSEETGHSILIQLKLNDKGSINVTLGNQKNIVDISYIYYIFNITSLDQLIKLIGDEPQFQRYLKNMLIQVTPSITHIKKKCISEFILEDMFPHLGISSSTYTKAVMLSCMVRKLLLTYLSLNLCPEDRDNYSNKRIEMAGVLCSELFKMLFKRFIKSCVLQFQKRKRVDLTIISKNNIITSGFSFCFSTGNWGVPKNQYIRNGVSQIPTPKVSISGFYSYLRRVIIPIGKEGKNTKIRQVHPSSIFFICPAETPEGQGIGIVLNLAITATVSLKTSTIIVSEFIFNDDIKTVKTKISDVVIFINGCIHGYTENPYELVSKINNFKYFNKLRKDISVLYNEVLKVINISSDPGRLIRPLINLKTNDLQFVDVYEVEELEIAMTKECITTHTHLELHPSCMLGIMTGQIPYANYTQSPRLCYQASMAKQAIGYIPSFTINGESKTMLGIQKPLVSTIIAEKNNLNKFPNGFNAIVAIACYTGFNQEDSIILNKGSIERGMFLVTTYKQFIIEEKKLSEEQICIPDVKIQIYGYNYNLLNDDGIIKIGSIVKKNDVIVGKVNTNGDCSWVIKYGEEGRVKNVFISYKKDIGKIVHIIISQLHVPEIGDKFCSGMAQKGTCGMILNEEDMPFTSAGLVPDIIINPHCLPSRMTINQIMACIKGKINCVKCEPYSDATPFNNEKLETLCKELQDNGCHYDGTELMYNGMTGEKLTFRIFLGPTYYHRLTHMVCNKIHARAQGQKTTLTRQPIPGRSNNGGLRIGEMEKDCILVHGIISFLNEKMFTLSDAYMIDVCSKCKTFTKIKKEDGFTICKMCNGTNIIETKIPYAAKLLCQELNAVGIKIEMS
ncbi:DNA-directed RNA polymerase subunit B [Spirochaetia bacterium]|nr:DNA-directed RNA polymerase subunit B [Spirochaetia bacterium]